MKAVWVREHGGPEVLRIEESPDPVPGPKEILVENLAIGVNFMETHLRAGRYPTRLPLIPGSEAAGVVAAVGENVTDLDVGDLVVYVLARSAYAEKTVVPEHRVAKVPQGLDANVAAAVLHQGMTAHYLTHSAYPLKPGDRALIHAGAGGVGLLAIQMAKRLGAYVFTTVSTESKAVLAKNAGADEVILYTRNDFEEEIRKATNGEGVRVVYDSVGKTTFEKSLNCLALRGYLVLFGSAGGLVPPVDPMVLASKGAVYLTRPGLDYYVSTREEFLWRADDVLHWVHSGDLKVRIHKTFSLAQAADGHREIESRKSAGKILLIP